MEEALSRARGAVGASAVSANPMLELEKMYEDPLGMCADVCVCGWARQSKCVRVFVIHPCFLSVHLLCLHTHTHRCASAECPESAHAHSRTHQGQIKGFSAFIIEQLASWNNCRATTMVSPQLSPPQAERRLDREVDIVLW